MQMLTVIHEYIRECLDVAEGRRMTSEDVLEALTGLIHAMVQRD